MYINLGSINLNYRTNLDDYIIVSEVVDSQLSYETPVLVRSKNELDIWFGKEFKDRDYFDELLQQGVTLYLYKPIQADKLKDKDYIDLSNYDEVSVISLEDIEEPQEDIIYKLPNNETYIYILEDFINTDLLPQNIDNNTSSLDNRDTLFITRNNLSCHPEFNYIQNDIGVFSNEIDYDGQEYVENLYNLDDPYRTIAFRVKYTGDSSTFDLGDPGFIVIANLNHSISEHFAVIHEKEDPDFYFNNEVSGFLCHNAENFNETFSEDYKNMGRYAFNNYTETNPEYQYKISTFQDLISMYQTLGYTCERINDKEYLVYSKQSYITRLSYFYTFKTITIEKDNRVNNNILYNYMKDLGYIKFWSKTIGNDEEKIKINLEKIEDDTYRVTISKYDYYEVFEGSVYPDKNEERLDFIISKYSRLVYCLFTPKTLKPGYTVEINNKIISTPDFYIELKENPEEIETTIKTRRVDNKYYLIEVLGFSATYKIGRGIIKKDSGIENIVVKDFELGTGDFYLSGAINEEGDFNEGLRYMFDSNKMTVYPDFLLIPDKYKYGSIPPYEQFLSIAEEYNLQVLVENIESPYKYLETPTLPDIIDNDTIYYVKNSGKFYLGNSIIEDQNVIEVAKNGGDFILNNLDENNRLLYFYKNILVNYNSRPGYYLHILGVLSNIFSYSSRYILYNEPENNTELLEKYKSNYLIFNNHMYYYKKYFDGENYKCTGWMRFILGKIERELNKNKGAILNTKFIGQSKNLIERILKTIKDKFSIVNSLYLTKFIPNLTENYLSVSIDVYVNELVNNNIKLNLTINI